MIRGPIGSNDPDRRCVRIRTGCLGGVRGCRISKKPPLVIHASCPGGTVASGSERCRDGFVVVGSAYVLPMNTYLSSHQ